MRSTKQEGNWIFRGMLCACALTAGSLQAQSADAIIDKLVDKGILTVEEANELREESDKGFEAGLQVKTGMPDWVTSMKIGGDFRGRFEHFSSSEETFRERSRFRYRVRPGIVVTIKDNFEVGFRLTSSEPDSSLNDGGASEDTQFGGDPISGNTTFTDNASKKFVYIDLAYGKWTPVNTDFWSAAFTIGKMQNPFSLSDLVFDSDYTPEGLAQQFSFALAEAHQLELNLGQFALEEAGNLAKDSYMLGAQARVESEWNEKWKTGFGVAALTILEEQRLSNTAVPNSNSGNLRDGGVPVASFNPIVLDGSVTCTLDSVPLYNAAFPIQLAGDWIHNPAADSENDGYSIGITFGKSGKKGLWDISYRWKHLEGDAWYEEVVDSDFGGLASGARASYRAGTNVEGHVFRMNYSPFNSITLGLTYYWARLIELDPRRSAGGAPADDFEEYVGRLMVDAIWKF